MNTYKLNVTDRHYNEFEIVDSATSVPAEGIDVDPVKSKLFNQDMFRIEDGETILLHSSIRSMPNIPAILVLEGNKRFGKTKKGRFLYRCIPDDRRFPEFLVPYTLKLGFSKNLYNKYVIFAFEHWDDKHPVGRLVNVLGDVSILDHFYEYQLYCKSLYASIQKFTKKTMRKLKSQSEDYFIETIMTTYNIADRRNHMIVSVDPAESKDFDDAFGVVELDDTLRLSIYISNVSLWLDIMGIWDSFSQRIATIYLPDRKRPMLPTILSDALCSLQENRTRFAFTLDIVLNKTTYEILETSYCNTAICVRENLRYDTKKMAKHKMYKKTFAVVEELNKKYKYMENMQSCHDMIAYLMILMNYLTAKEMVTRKIGIYRSVKGNKNFVAPKHLPNDIAKFLKMWNSFGGNYVQYENIQGHDLLDLDAYVHITSPIRRLIDLLNIMVLQDSLELLAFNEHSNIFYKKWTEKSSFDYINRTMRSIRKVQNDCHLLKFCMTNKNIRDKLFEGFIFDKIVRNDALYQYMVYLPELKMVNRFTSRYEKENHTKQMFKLFVFIDETRLKQKIRIELVE